MRTRRPRYDALPPVRREVIRAAASFMNRFGRFNSKLFSPEDNLHIYQANIELANPSIFLPFIGSRLPKTNNWTRFYLKARDERPSLNEKRAPFVGYVALQRTEGSDAPGHIQHVWEARYDIDSFRNRCRITRSVTGKVISHAYEEPREVAQLPGIDAVRDQFPRKLNADEARQLIILLKDPESPTKVYFPREIYLD